MTSRLLSRNGLSNAERAQSCRILHRSPTFACIKLPTQATHRVFALAQIDLAATKGVFLVPASVVARNTVSRDDIASATCPTTKGRPTQWCDMWPGSRSEKALCSNHECRRFS